MAKRLVYRKRKHFSGWACSACDWAKPLPRFAEDDNSPPADVKREFDEHACAKHSPKGPAREDMNQAAVQSVGEATEATIDSQE